jgi:signal transduction histidine kinase
MTPIIGQVQMLLARLRREGASPSIIGSVERLEAAVAHYIRRATALLEISRLNAGGSQLNPSTFDMAELVNETCRAYQPIAMRAGIELSCSTDGPAVGTWDRLSIEQILDNLISNAIRYGDGKPVDVKLTCGEEAVVLSVADQGIGIAEENQTRIFERFEQAMGNGRRAGGFGLGLWLVRELVVMHNGAIEVASKVGVGSTFTVTLPRHVGERTMREHAK